MTQKNSKSRKCFWSKCSNHKRCDEFGSCVAIYQSAHKDELFAPIQSEAKAPAVSEAVGYVHETELRLMDEDGRCAELKTPAYANDTGMVPVYLAAKFPAVSEADVGRKLIEFIACFRQHEMNPNIREEIINFIQSAAQSTSSPGQG